MAKVSANYEVVYIIDPMLSEEQTAALGLEIPVHGDADGRHRGAALRPAQLRVTDKTSHKNDAVEHALAPSYSPLQTIRERMIPSVIRRTRSSSLGKAGALVKFIST